MYEAFRHLEYQLQYTRVIQLYPQTMFTLYPAPSKTIVDIVDIYIYTHVYIYIRASPMSRRRPKQLRTDVFH